MTVEYLKLQNNYLENVLINLLCASYTFYEIELILKYQNGKFKSFRSDGGSLLQKIDKIFCLHTFTIDWL